jgi:hypothetical protein
MRVSAFLLFALSLLTACGSKDKTPPQPDCYLQWSINRSQIANTSIQIENGAVQFKTTGIDQGAVVVSSDKKTILKLEGDFEISFSFEGFGGGTGSGLGGTAGFSVNDLPSANAPYISMSANINRFEAGLQMLNLIENAPDPYDFKRESFTESELAGKGVYSGAC